MKGVEFMYRTYKKPIDTELSISMWDGDTMCYTVFESKDEMEIEKERIRKIEKECQEAKKSYLESLEE